MHNPKIIKKYLWYLASHICVPYCTPFKGLLENAVLSGTHIVLSGLLTHNFVSNDHTFQKHGSAAICTKAMSALNF